MEILEIPKNPQKHLCELCDYITSNKKDFIKHTATVKHINNVNGNKMEVQEIAISPSKETYACNCSKIFMTNSGLWKHKQQCNAKSKVSSEGITSLTNLVLEVVKSNTEFQKQTIEFHKQIMVFQKQILDIVKNT